MQFAATARPIGEQTFEELHRGGHRDRAIPPFHGKSQPVRPRAVVRPCAFAGHLEGAVVRQHRTTQGAERASINSRRLLDDRREWDHRDHPIQPVRPRVGKGEGKGRQRLSATDRRGQREDTRRLCAQMAPAVGWSARLVGSRSRASGVAISPPTANPALAFKRSITNATIMPRYVKMVS